MTQSISTLGEFLQAGKADYQVFDLGRCLHEIDQTTFDRIERQQQPYPFPIRQQAQLAVLFRHRQQPDNDYLWFIQLPLDERGLLSSAARDHYLEFVLNALGHEITGSLTDEQEQQLKQNPYLFTPSDVQRAALHARIAVQRRAAPSLYFDDAETYLASQQGDWQNLGMQGLHDCAARLAQLPQLCAAIASHFTDYPAAVRQQLAAALEHQPLPAKLRDALVTVAATSTAETRCDAMRALASCAEQGPVIQLIRNQLTTTASESLDADRLTVMAARLWPALADPTRLTRYIHAIAQLQPVMFDALFQDIISLPQLRPLLLSLLAQGQLSNDSLQALNRLKQNVQG
ncbi:DUF3549 domain-containing protein [Idiomarina sp. OT37-5b]|uniref:DUF3549 family protein n=1 Tax=Idiomarina sp. OT37-5b TaxID=2100422 RepID=UPI000CF9D1CF|nr:DUF3549 family protein [Idiomarina sp. OT37-5b]AVJ55664.1 DUF3549 domain-containing protein [Idiomarina sp. OT37-5b]